MPRQTGDVILEVEDLHTYCFTRWGVVKAVDGVSFSLRQGEALGIVGESGCGKTMTALSLLRLQPRPAARIVKGAIRLEGENLLDKTEREMRSIRGRRISMILQDPQTSQAVDGISFSIPQGETLALVGESGCGKTTTAKLILRLERPTAGQVFIDGKDVHALNGNALKEYRTMVQAVFQDPWSSLSPRMRVQEIVAEPLVVNRRVSSKEVKERVAEILGQVGLRPQQADLYPHEFSGGQRQRIAVASALVSNPKLIILDEPVSALDVSIRAQIMNLLVDLQKQYQVSYLLIAHHLATTRYMAYEVAVMYLGKIVEKAKTKELFRNPLHPYTKALFSAALPAHPDIAREEMILPGEVPSPINPPSGCRFHPRCPFAMPKCAEIEPEEKEIATDHLVACHLY